MNYFENTREIEDYIGTMTDHDEIAKKMTADGYDINDLLIDYRLIPYSLNDYIKNGIIFGAPGRDRAETDAMLATEIAAEMRYQDTWDFELCEQLCELAGLEEEWKDADEDTFEQIIFRAAEILKVEVI